ncbi:TRAP transporter small permease subunit [Indiicoccus explosivorum]|uniref:TRAP transporter small permease subunit n=1 Tax=Indiicoccus explosivorum TaxID=1917864 RepID=UPI001F4E0E90|nr:TRAP transporter small permease [Indiicoccus explosivorum]
MMGFIVYDVIARNLFAGSINGGFEIVQNYFMPLVVFPGLAYAYSSGVLPKMDLVIERIPENAQRLLVIVMILIELFVLLLLVQFTWQFAMNGLEREEGFPAAGRLYPLYPLFFLIPISFALIAIENLFLLIRNLAVKEPTLLMMGEDQEAEDPT